MLNSPHDSDRLIRELMVKNNTLQSKLDGITEQENARNAAAGKLQAQLAAAQKDVKQLASELQVVQQERDALLAAQHSLTQERNELVRASSRYQPGTYLGSQSGLLCCCTTAQRCTGQCPSTPS